MSEPTQGSAAAVTIGVPKETTEGERRVAITPAVLAALQKIGASVVLESGAGEGAGFSDESYTEKGVRIGSRDEVFAADVVAMVNVLGGDPAGPDLGRLRQGQVVVGMAAPLAAPELSSAVAGAGAILFSLELVPRTTRAQPMDVLSSQANVAGYKAVLIAASALTKIFPLLTTAAGTISPARVFVVGAGVAGLSAIATAKRLGAVVEAYDVRPAVKEEVKSLGGRFLEIELDTGQEGEGSGAYAGAMSEEAIAKQRELMTKTVAASDVVITTAQVQGARAPVLVTAEMVAAMKPGSVIVDLAAPQGGNVEPSRPGEEVVENGVLIIGPRNLPATLAHDASLTYAKNVANFLGLLVKDGTLTIDTEDDIVRESMVTRDGRIVHDRVRSALDTEGVAR